MDELVERILIAVELVPPGQVVTYGDLAALVRTNPRLVGTIMNQWASDVPWWRVVNAAGDLPKPLLARAHQHWKAEGFQIKSSGNGIRISEHRADLSALLLNCEEAWSALD